MRKLYLMMSLAVVANVSALDTPSFAQGQATSIISVTYDPSVQKNDIWAVDPSTGSSKLMLQFKFPSGSYSASGSFTDTTSGKVYLADSRGGYVVYDLATNSTSFLQFAGGNGGYSSSPILPGGTNGIISTTTDVKGNPASALGTATIVTKSGSNLIGTDSDGAIHIGPNSLVTVESNGKQLLYATDASGNPIALNVTNGSDLQINGVSVGASIAAINATGTTYLSTNATGQAAAATGANSIAGGAASVASGTGSVALGQGAIATGNNSVALGSGSLSTVDNTVSVGRPGADRRITNVAPGIDATDAVTVAQLHSAANRATSGVSMAMAMSGGYLPDDKRFAISMNQGFFGGTTATAFSSYLRAHENVVVSGGVSYGYATGQIGSRVGVQFAW